MWQYHCQPWRASDIPRKTRYSRGIASPWAPATVSPRWTNGLPVDNERDNSKQPRQPHRHHQNVETPALSAAWQILASPPTSTDARLRCTWSSTQCPDTSTKSAMCGPMVA